MILSFDYEDLVVKWLSEDVVEVFWIRFLIVNLVDEEGGNGDDDDFFGFDDDDEDDEGDGVFEDFEIGEVYGGDGDEDEDEDGDEDESEELLEVSLEVECEKNVCCKEEFKLCFEEEDCEGFKNDKVVVR